MKIKVQTRKLAAGC